MSTRSRAYPWFARPLRTFGERMLQAYVGYVDMMGYEDIPILGTPECKRLVKEILEAAKPNPDDFVEIRTVLYPNMKLFYEYLDRNRCRLKRNDLPPMTPTFGSPGSRKEEDQ